MDVNLFLSAIDIGSSEDSQEDILEEEMLDDTVIEDTQVDSEKDDQHLIIRLFSKYQTVHRLYYIKHISIC